MLNPMLLRVIIILRVYIKAITFNQLYGHHLEEFVNVKFSKKKK